VKQRLTDLDPVIGLASYHGEARVVKSTWRFVHMATGGRRGPDQSWEEALALAFGADVLRENAQKRPPEVREFLLRLAQVAERLEQNQPPPPAQSKDSFG
jgi:hypothetical protein